MLDFINTENTVPWHRAIIAWPAFPSEYIQYSLFVISFPSLAFIRCRFQQQAWAWNLGALRNERKQFLKTP